MTFPDLIAMLCSRNRWTPFFGYIQKPAVLLPAGVLTKRAAYNELVSRGAGRTCR